MSMFKYDTLLGSDNIRVYIKDGCATIYETNKEIDDEVKRETYEVIEGISEFKSVNGVNDFVPTVKLGGKFYIPSNTLSAEDKWEEFGRKMEATQLLNNHLMSLYIKHPELFTENELKK